MVGFIPEPTSIVKEEKEEAKEEKNQAFKFLNLKESIEPFDFAFDDSFIDFDSIREFFQGSPQLDTVSLFDNIDFVEMGDKDCCFDTNPVVGSSSLSFEGSKLIEDQSCESVVIKEEKIEFEFEKEGNLGSFIEEEMGRVSLAGGLSPNCGDGFVVKSEAGNSGIEVKTESLVSAVNCVTRDGSVAGSGAGGAELVTGNGSLVTGSFSVDGLVGSGVKNVIVDDVDESENDLKSASESCSYSTSSSGSDDDDEEEEEEMKMKDVRKQVKREVEEGEIEDGEIREVNGEEMVTKIDEEEEERDKMVEWSDVEFDDFDEEEGTGVMRGPIRSQNELKVLPPVPAVDVTLQPHHQMLPVGIVLSVLGAQVIVEGVEKHNPLNEGSILWITEKRAPLGLVDEIFGPVQHPYYVVRYNSESEVPSGVNQGTSVSFVSEFAHHVLNEKNLYKKGYDASGDNDEELIDEAEFSDDEKEAEYMRMKKMSKRGINDQPLGNKKKKDKNRNKNRKDAGPSGEHASMSGVQLPPNQNQHYNISSAAASMNNCSSSNFTGGASFFQPFSPMAPTAAIFQPSSAVWLNGLPPPQHTQNILIPGGFSANNMAWPTQNQMRHPGQMPIMNGMPFQQQFNPSQGTLPIPNGVSSGGQMNPFAGPLPWAAAMGQNCFNQTPFGLSLYGQPTMNPMNVGEMSSGLGMQQNSNLQLPAVVGGNNIQVPQQFNSGGSRGRGRRQYNRGRGGGHFGGRKPSN